MHDTTKCSLRESILFCSIPIYRVFIENTFHIDCMSSTQFIQMNLRMNIYESTNECGGNCFLIIEPLEVWEGGEQLTPRPPLENISLATESCNESLKKSINFANKMWNRPTETFIVKTVWYFDYLPKIICTKIYIFPLNYTIVVYNKIQETSV